MRDVHTNQLQYKSRPITVTSRQILFHQPSFSIVTSTSKWHSFKCVCVKSVVFKRTCVNRKMFIEQVNSEREDTTPQYFWPMSRLWYGLAHGLLLKIEYTFVTPQLYHSKIVHSRKILFVKQQSEYIDLYHLNSGVPQCSILRPVLHSLYTVHTNI